ncbi:MAG: glycosyltransferase [Brumimicrobium sp.]
MIETPINSIKQQRVLLSPLNWGLGHVTRTIPIIQTLLKNENEVIVCCDNQQENIYRTYFPELWYVPHGGYPFDFKGKGMWALDILRQFFILNSFLHEELKRVEDLVAKFDVDLVLSDQRFGFRSDKIRSIVISHQLNLPVSKWNVFAKYWNIRLLNKFDEIWVPDATDSILSGAMSKLKLKKKRYIGSCSRFQNDAIEKLLPHDIKYKYLGLASGPSPYLEKFISLLVEKFKLIQGTCAIISPIKCENLFFDLPENISFIYAPSHEDFLEVLLKSKTVISRSGYSTLMDLLETGNKAILIPTKGQKEQEYLSKIHSNNAKWKFVDEDSFEAMQL